MKHTYKHTKPQSSWLLQGLMIRAGLYDPLPPVPQKLTAKERKAEESRWRERWNQIKAAFVYDPDRT